MNKTAVLLLQMGGPDSLDLIEPFLYSLFSDRDIIRIGPGFLQPLIARFISRKRTRKVSEYYKQIGNGSPIRKLTEQQALELEKTLGEGYRCFVAMRYSKPDTREALAAIRREGISRVIVLSLYPHFSRATTGSSLNELERELRTSGKGMELSYVRQFYDHPLYISALVEKIEQGLAGFGDRSGVQLVFSAHGLPQSFIDSGDPYLDHIQATVRLAMERFGDVSHHLAFQSRAGPVKWLEPSTEETMAKLAGEGCTKLLMVPLSFVSDHIETLYEIDIQYREEAAALGITDFRRSESLNSSPAFIACLAELVRSAR
ncbi:ferrochelatase [Geobacter sp. SVR]|uniref:ferrochelatase n=1 Tax=Geobacter sp. SVR TaxID=2495594 RepID=UPI00143EFEC3|nr:ferrochelatase [Geobacter sp. SVR]BCS55150.1 ferrochelatase [Geobacter sp. SVR]GCF85331.1 ferrochelatase [Geobacter sp. SVR]